MRFLGHIRVQVTPKEEESDVERKLDRHAVLSRNVNARLKRLELELGIVRRENGHAA